MVFLRFRRHLPQRKLCKKKTTQPQYSYPNTKENPSQPYSTNSQTAPSKSSRTPDDDYAQQRTFADSTVYKVRARYASHLTRLTASGFTKATQIF